MHGYSASQSAGIPRK